MTHPTHFSDCGSRIKEIIEREKKATISPWNYSKQGGITQTQHVTRDVWTIPKSEDDMEFIAHARQDIPWLVARVQALEKLAGEMATMLERAMLHVKWRYDYTRDPDFAQALFNFWSLCSQVTLRYHDFKREGRKEKI